MSGAGASPYAYSNGAIFASEAIATCITIYLGESIIANEVLAKTKGGGMGWGFVALGFGLSFGVSIFMLGYISAHLNPATCLALWILGKLDGIQFVCACAGEFLGAWVGAVLVWLHFVPHFKTVPEPPARENYDRLLRSRDALSSSALNIASYTTDGIRGPPDEGKGPLAKAIGDIKYYINSKYYQPTHASHANLVALVSTSTYRRTGN
jgi:glycerol uptake facilitator-like aquaporin